MPLETSITGENHPGYSPQSPVVDSTLRLILFFLVYLLLDRVDMDRNVIFIAFCYPKCENAHRNLKTGEIHPGNSPQSPVVDSTSRLIHFSGVFVVGKGRYGQKCDLYSILLPKK